MESLLLVCVALMFSFYSLGKIHLWYSVIDFCVVSQRINLLFRCPTFQRIQFNFFFVYFSLKEKNIKCKSSFYFAQLHYLCRQRVSLFLLRW